MRNAYLINVQVDLTFLNDISNLNSPNNQGLKKSQKTSPLSFHNFVKSENKIKLFHNKGTYERLISFES